MPEFSVIVPIYRVEKYLRECIESVLRQSYTDFELILVDDGSPDACPQICDEYATRDTRVKVVHKRNGGSNSARKAGARIATGDYITCLDGDDWVSDDYFSVLHDAVETYHADVIAFGSIWEYPDRSVTYPAANQGFYDKTGLQKEIFPYLIHHADGRSFAPSVWGKAIKRELYVPAQESVDDRIRIGEDMACVKPILYRAKSLYIASAMLYHYRQNEESVTKNKKTFDLNEAMLIARHFESTIDVNQYDFQAQVHRMVVHKLFNACVSQYNQPDARQAKHAIINALQEPYYQNAIRNCHYNIGYWKGQLARIALKYKLFFLMRLYGKIK